MPDNVRRGGSTHAARVELVDEAAAAERSPAEPAAPSPGAQRATSEVLTFLGARLPMQQWMVTRVDGERWTVVATAGEGAFRTGDVRPWRDTLCAAMVDRGAPRCAPDVNAVAQHAQAPLRAGLQIGAYVGVPLAHEDGSLFGTLCAIDPSPQPVWLHDDLPLVELCAGMLSSLLSIEVRAQEEARRAERAEVEALTDPLTGLANRRAWDRLLAAEEARCRRHNHPAAVVMLDVDGLKAVNDRDGHAAGDLLLAGAARALTQSTREHDVVARLGGDEFGILCVESDATAAATVTRRLRTALAARGISASIGMAARTAGAGILGAAEAADQAMYADKQERRRAGQAEAAGVPVDGGARRTRGRKATSTTTAAKTAIW